MESFFDLEQGVLLWKINPEIGWADSYYFDCEKAELHLIYKDRGTYRCSFMEDFLDREK